MISLICVQRVIKYLTSIDDKINALQSWNII